MMTSRNLDSICYITLVLVSWTASVIGLPAGSTRSLEQIVLGRCLEYQTTMHREQFAQSPLDCDKLWRDFSGAFANKEPCSVAGEDFDPFLTLAFNRSVIHQVAFWSGVKQFAKSFGLLKSMETVLEETLPGYLLDGLTFCGQREAPGVNYDKCPAWGSCAPSQSAETAFWNRASITFAQLASGDVKVFLNGSKSMTAFRNNSIFGMHELPNLNAKKVTSMTAVLVYDLNLPRGENCDSDSLRQLRTEIEAKDIVFHCSDNSLDVMHYICVTNPDDSRCRPLTSSGSRHVTSASLFVSVLVLCHVYLTSRPIAQSV